MPSTGDKALWMATAVCHKTVSSLREEFTTEIGGQSLRFSFYQREGWVKCYQLHAGERVAGYGAVVVAGPWRCRPAIFEFYVVPNERTHTFALFEALLEAHSSPLGVATQTNAPLLPLMLHVYCTNVATESVVFEDANSNARVAPPAPCEIRQLTSAADTAAALSARRGSCDFEVVTADGQVVATGGIGFHYNPVAEGLHPFGDIYYEVVPGKRRQGWASYLAVALKSACYALGSVPTARCNSDNHASRRTLQRAGFVPVALAQEGTLANDAVIHSKL